MQFIENPHQLAGACERWSDCDWLALDTEFVRVDTYFARPCLLQISDGGEEVVIDVLAVRDLDPLIALLGREDRVKVFHSGWQDLEIFTQLGGAPPRPLFDTQIAAELLGEGSQIGYAALVERRLGVVLDKSLTRTDWARRPLARAELDYAAADVQHLARLYPMLHDELAACGRLGWLHEECARLVDPALYRTRPEEAWRRLKGLSRLPPSAQPAAMALAEWRERVAIERNRPRRWILADDALYGLAERRPRDARTLAATGLLPPKTLARYGDVLVEVLADAPTASPGFETPSPLDLPQKKRLDALRERLDACARRLGVPPPLLATRADLERIVREGAGADVLLARGWRREAVGKEMLDLA